MTTTDIKLLTADDLLRLYSHGLRGELIRGVLSERRPGGVESGEIIGLVAFEIGNFLNRHNLGRATIGAGFWLEREPDTVRRAQVAFISSQKLPPSQRVSESADIPRSLRIWSWRCKDSIETCGKCSTRRACGSAMESDLSGWCTRLLAPWTFIARSCLSKPSAKVEVWTV